jgi:hypothetical protein
MGPTFHLIEMPKDLKKFGEKIGAYIREKASENPDEDKKTLEPAIFRNLLELLMKEGLIVFETAEERILGKKDPDTFSRRALIVFWNDLHKIVSECG